jgi:hypothetical protein
VAGAAGVDLALLRGGAAFLAPWVATALRSRAWRLARSFFLTCALRRLMFIELRRSCFPTGGSMPTVGAARQGATQRIARPPGLDAVS